MDGAHGWLSSKSSWIQKTWALLSWPVCPQSCASHKNVAYRRQEGTTQREEIAQGASGGQRGVTPGITFQIVDPQLIAYNKETGKYIGEVSLPHNATGAPMTYILNRKQHIIIPTGGANLPAELIVLRLP